MEEALNEILRQLKLLNINIRNIETKINTLIETNAHLEEEHLDMVKAQHRMELEQVSQRESQFRLECTVTNKINDIINKRELI